MFTVMKAAAHWKHLPQQRLKRVDEAEAASCAEGGALRNRAANILQSAAQSGALRQAFVEIAANPVEQHGPILQQTRLVAASTPSSAPAFPPRAPSREEEIEAGQELLRQRCRFLGLMTMDMLDDGNCQFRAMAQELYASQEHHGIVRAAVVDYLGRNADKYAAFFEAGTWEDYLRTMAALRTWGDELTLRAAAEVFNIRIHVISSTETNWYIVYEPEKGLQDDARNLFITYVSPIHYNTVAPLR